MCQHNVVAIALALSVACAGCESWTGGGFRTDGPEMPRLRQALALETGKVVADVGAGKGGLTFALAEEVGPKGHVFSTDIEPVRLRALREAAASRGNVTVVEGQASETGLPPNCCDAIVLRR